MKLDDRPVIDQLTEPTPLNHLHDTREYMDARIHNAEDATANAIRGTLEEELSSCLVYLREVDEDGDLIEEIDRFVRLAAADETDRLLEAVRLFADELEARL